MGCDIHLYLEYKHPEWGIEPLIGGGYTVARDYRLFTALAGVRNYDDVSVRFAPRGIPDDLSTEVYGEYYYEILSDDATDLDKNMNRTWCYWAEANMYSKEHGAQIVENREISYVSCPDWHSASYLSLDEVREACRTVDYDLSAAPQGFQIVLDFMSCIDDRFGAGASRIVFWFDN